MPLFPALRKQILVDSCKFKAKLVYIVTSKTTWTTWQDLVSRKGGWGKRRERKGKYALDIFEGLERGLSG